MREKRLYEIIENINKHNILQNACGGISSYDNAISELAQYTLDLKQKKELAIKLLKRYIGVLDDTADLYFKNVLEILEDKHNGN
ncbi:MAG: hypothetical protein V8R01_01485 [Bacilli bacterium]